MNNKADLTICANCGGEMRPNVPRMGWDGGAVHIANNGFNCPSKILEEGMNKEIDNQGIWWCNSHNRVATHLDNKGRHCCDPNLGGKLLPCFCVLLPVKIVE